MNAQNPFRADGQWYRGALHVHTTESDGRYTPAEAAQAYRTNGYHFLAVTDHNVVTDISSYDDADFVTIPGVELNYDENAAGMGYHLVALGATAFLELPKDIAVQDAIDCWADAAIMHLAHPYWSGLAVAEMMALEGLVGLEIYNHSADTDLGKALATVHWDNLLAQGKRWWGFAVDDVHWLGENSHVYDVFGGWVWAKAEGLSRHALLQALKYGMFYASTGPQIHDFALDDGVVYVRCSDVTRINFIGQTQWGVQRRAAPGQTITDAEVRLDKRQRYLRVECIDACGRAAWTNPVFL
jgi:hypothetical protein